MQFLGQELPEPAPGCEFVPDCGRAVVGAQKLTVAMCAGETGPGTAELRERVAGMMERYRPNAPACENCSITCAQVVLLAGGVTVNPGS